MTWLWFDIDTQRDFMLPDGALAVPGAQAIIANLFRLVRRSGADAIPLVSSMDSHTPDDPEFADFPPHCVVGTLGHEKIPETLRPDAVRLDNLDAAGVARAVGAGRQIIVGKSTFDVFTNPRLVEILDVDIERVAVFGVATDYCVRACVMGCRSRGLKTLLVTDLRARLCHGMPKSRAEDAAGNGRDCRRRSRDDRQGAPRDARGGGGESNDRRTP